MINGRGFIGRLATYLLVFSLTWTAGRAGEIQEPVGARPVGMAETFVGIADDGNAVYWNPAGMVFLNHHEVTTMHSDLFGLGLKNYYAAYVYPVSDRFAFGLDWFSLGYNDDDLGYDFSTINLALALRVRKDLAVGGLLKYLGTSTSFEDQTIGKGKGWAASLGVLYKANARFSAGLSVSNLTDAYITYDNGVRAKWYDSRMTLGCSYRPREQLLIAADIGDRLHLGAEYIYRGKLALRGGLQGDLADEKEVVLSLGTGIKFKPFQFDYSYTHHPHLQHTNRVSLSAFFNFGISLIRVRDVRLVSDLGLFPSLWHTYRSVPVVEFTLHNRSNRPLACDWEIELAEMMDAPSSGQVVLRPQEEKKVRASAQFSERFYTNRTDVFKSGRIKVSYHRERDSREAKTNFQAFIYGRNAIDWNADVSWIAGFVNPKDAVVRRFTSELLDREKAYSAASAARSRIAQAMIVLNGLRSYGTKYLSDPSSPYQEARQKGRGIDDVQYPVDLLNSKQGDCDDLTVLLCAMLESIGTRTVVLDVPGHLFMMFSTGVPSMYAISLQISEDLYVDYEGEVFIPVEVTEVASGFMTAWQVGARAYDRWVELDAMNHIDLREAWKVYPPVPLSLKLRDWNVTTPQLETFLSNDTAVLAGLSREFMERQYTDNIRRLSSDPAVLNASAISAIHAGDLDEAESLLRKARAAGPSDNKVLCNLASLLSLSGGFEEAFELFARIEDSAFAISHAVCNMLVAKCLEVDRDVPGGREVLVQFLADLNVGFKLSARDPEGYATMQQCLTDQDALSCRALAACLYARDGAESVSPGESTGKHDAKTDVEKRGGIFRWYQ